jgi:hypothetical protein
VCWPNAFQDDAGLFRCFPDETDELFPDDVCLAMYAPELHELAMTLGVTQSYGSGGGGSVGVSDTLEVGTAYGRDGCYGCYITNCVGLETNVQVSVFAGIGLYDVDLDGFQGPSISTVESAGIELIAFATSQQFTPNWELIGTADYVSFGLGISPISAGVYECQTVLDKVGCLNNDNDLEVITNNAPVAQCEDFTTCADDVTCTASATVDSDSYDPDGESIIRMQIPPGPFGIGEHLVILTVTDPSDEYASCAATLTVNDCTNPQIVCPAPTTAECQSNAQAVVDPGDATTSDCTNVDVTDPRPSSYPMGTTSVSYQAVDQGDNEAGCQTTVTVVDTTPPQIVCPAPTTAECQSARQSLVDPGDAIVDDCTSFTVTDPGPASYPLGATVVHYEAVDSVDNAAGCNTTVMVQDTTPPDIDCPADQTVECDASTQPSETGTASATDACYETLAMDHADQIAAGGCASESIITRTWTATDDSQHRSQCEQAITVVDTTAAVISCHAPSMMTPSDAPVTWTATAEDNCCDELSVEIIAFDCFTFTNKGKRIDKRNSCQVQLSGDQITILDFGGVDDHITWTIRAVDCCGNVREQTCEVLVVNPGGS